MQEKLILLVKDNPDDALLTVRALQKNNFYNKAIVARAGEEAFNCLFHTSRSANRAAEPSAQVILLDLKLPKLDGSKSSENLVAPRVPQSSFALPRTRSKTVSTVLAWPQNSFVQKPVEFDRFSEAVRQLDMYRLLINHIVRLTSFHVALDLANRIKKAARASAGPRTR